MGVFNKEKIQKHAITVYGNEYITMTDSNWTKYTNFTQKVKIGTKLSLSNGGILIGKGVNHVRVSGQFMLNSMASAGLKYGAIFTNEETARITFTGQYISVNQETIVAMPTVLVPVAEGDILYLKLKGVSGDRFGANGNGQIQLTVEMVD